MRAPNDSGDNSARMNFVVAHAAEARPLLEEFQLQQLEAHEPFRVYANATMHLVVSGTGRVAAAAAAAYLYGLTGGIRQQAWLNIGIGGHADLPLGAARVARKVTDHSTGRKWFPVRNSAALLQAADVLTVDSVESTYDVDAIYDMEAAGFCEACMLFSSPELVQVVKVVSDNRENPYQRMTPKQGERLIADALGIINSLIVSTMTVEQERHATSGE